MGARQSKTPGPVADVSGQPADVSGQEIDVSSQEIDVSNVAVDVSGQTDSRGLSTLQEIVEPTRTTSLFSCCSSLPADAKPTPVVVPENKDSEVAATQENKGTEVKDTEIKDTKESDVGSQDPASA